MTSIYTLFSSLTGLSCIYFLAIQIMPSQPMNVRKRLRQKFFSLCNNTPIHYDADFPPLTTDKIVRTLVRTLSKTKGVIRDYTPLHVPLKSEESNPIQVTDIIAGTINSKIRDFEKPPEPLSHLFFDNRKMTRRARKRGRFAKAYYWVIDE